MVFIFAALKKKKIRKRESFAIFKGLKNWTCPNGKHSLKEGDNCLGCELVKSVVYANSKLMELNPSGMQVPLVAHGRFIDSSSKKSIDAFKQHVRLSWKHMVFPILEDILFHQRNELDELRFECLFDESFFTK